MSTIAVTGLNATDNPAPGVAVARALKRADPETRVVGFAYDLLDPGNFAPEWFDDVFLIPYPSQGSDVLQSRLAEILDAVRLDAVIPNLDSELPAFVTLEGWLHEQGVGTFLPTRQQFDLRGKLHLADLGERADLPVPETAVLSDTSELYTLHEKLPYPIVVKGVFYGATVCHSLEDALHAYHDVLAKWGAPVLAQRVIRGKEIDVCAVGDGAGGLLGAVPMRKTLLTDKGKGWAGVAVKDPEALAMTERFMEASDWRGPCEVELIRDEDGKTWLLEINPRFPAWCYMTAAAGANLPWLAARAAMGDTIAPERRFEPGTMFVRISIDQIARLDDYEALATTGSLVDRNRRFDGENR